MARKLSPEQLKQVEEFLKTVPEEEREAKMQELLAELEQGEDTPQCPFCLMASGGLSTFTVYEDNDLMAVLEIKPANPGHILLFPKVHVAQLKEVKPEVVESLLRMAYTLANIVRTFAEGVNMLFSEGGVAGQRFPHVVVHILPRVKEDGVKIEWKANPLGEKELGLLRDKILAAVKDLTMEKTEKAPPDVAGVKEWLTKQRKRRP